MAIGIDGKEKPVFEEGERVLFNYDGKVRGRGRIRGKASEHVIDTWIVEIDEVENLDRSVYPWSCIIVPHPQLERWP